MNTIGISSRTYLTLSESYYSITLDTSKSILSILACLSPFRYFIPIGVTKDISAVVYSGQGFQVCATVWMFFLFRITSITTSQPPVHYQFN